MFYTIHISNVLSLNNKCADICCLKLESSEIIQANADCREFRILSRKIADSSATMYIKFIIGKSIFSVIAKENNKYFILFLLPDEIPYKKSNAFLIENNMVKMVLIERSLDLSF